MHFRCAGEDLKRSDKIENLDAGPRKEDDAPRSRFERRFIIVNYVFRFQFEKPGTADPGASALINVSGAASKLFLSSFEQK